MWVDWKWIIGQHSESPWGSWSHWSVTFPWLYILLIWPTLTYISMSRLQYALALGNHSSLNNHLCTYRRHFPSPMTLEGLPFRQGGTGKTVPRTTEQSLLYSSISHSSCLIWETGINVVILLHSPRDCVRCFRNTKTNRDPACIQWIYNLAGEQWFVHKPAAYVQ